MFCINSQRIKLNKVKHNQINKKQLNAISFSLLNVKIKSSIWHYHNKKHILTNTSPPFWTWGLAQPYSCKPGKLGASGSGM